MIGHHKFIILIEINVLMLWLHKKSFLSTYFRIKVIFSIGVNIESHNNLHSFNDWAPQIHITYWDKGIDALVS